MVTGFGSNAGLASIIAIIAIAIRLFFCNTGIPFLFPRFFQRHFLITIMLQQQ